MGIREQIIHASKEKFNSIEGKLSGILHPIHPRQEFVRGLQQRIRVVNPSALVKPVSSGELLLLILAGAVSISVLAVIAVRAVRSLLMLLGANLPSAHK